MKLLNKKLTDFKPIHLDENVQDDSYFDLLNNILKKIKKSGQKSSNTLSSMKDEILSEVGKTSDILNDMRDSRMKVLHDNDKLEKGILEYNDIVENLNRAAITTDIPELGEMTGVAVKALSQINAKLGVNNIPSEPYTAADPEYHIIVGTDITENNSYVDQISKTIEIGYRRGDKVLRRSSVTIFKDKDTDNG
jgi:molecular chaperone GrpE (heat shock protein)